MMMNSPSMSLPPSVPTDAAILGAFSLLQALGNAQNSAAILGQMAEHKKAIDEATAAHAAAAVAATQARADLANLQEREKAITAQEAAVEAAQTQLQVASAAVAERDAAVKAKEEASDKRAAEIEARAKAFDVRLAAYRQALA